MEVSASNTGMVLTLALSYGSREEMLSAFRCLHQELLSQERGPETIGLEDIERHLWTCGLPGDLDLIIRTSGEQRLSNFLLWQAAYAELWFTDVLWPDFSEAILLDALRDYASRQRRFGGLEEEG